MPDRLRSATFLRLLTALLTATAWHAAPAHAVFLSGEALDTAADAVSWLVLILVPVIVIVVFWMVHVLPEKIAHRRHHPQRQAIQTLCLLSLVFGGLLWPIAWIMAYSKPVLYKLAYGKDKHDDYYRHLAASDQAEARSLGDDITRLRTEIDRLAGRGNVPEELLTMRRQLAELEARLPPPPAAQAEGA